MTTDTASRQVTILNESGMHLRPAAEFVRLANKHKGCEVSVLKDDQRVNGKSIMGLVMLAASQGTVLIIECSGEGAEAACEDLAALINSQFGMQH